MKYKSDHYLSFVVANSNKTIKSISSCYLSMANGSLSKSVLLSVKDYDQKRFLRLETLAETHQLQII